MYRKLLLLSVVLATLSDADAGLDLSAERQEFVVEGIMRERLSFKDGERKVSMDLPPRWQFRSGPGRLELIPPIQFASGSIEALPLNAPQPPWDEEALKALVQQVVKDAPASSQNVEVAAEQQNTVVLDGRIPSFEVVLSYRALGQSFKRSTLFINLPDTQLVCRFTAPESEFDALSESFRRTINSWEWSEAKPAQSAASAAAPATGAAAAGSGAN